MKLAATILTLMLFALCACALAGCKAAPHQADPFTATTGAGLSKATAATDAAKWSNDQVAKESSGRVKTLAQATGHSLDQAHDGIGEALAGNQATAAYVGTVEENYRTEHAKVVAYDNGLLGGKAIRLWHWSKGIFWTVLIAYIAFEIGAKFFSASPFGMICGTVLRIVKAPFIRKAAPTAAEV